MDVNDIKDEEKRVERVTVALTPTVYAKLEMIFKKKNKRPSTLLRELVEEFVDDPKNQPFFDSAS